MVSERKRAFSGIQVIERNLSNNFIETISMCYHDNTIMCKALTFIYTKSG